MVSCSQVQDLSTFFFILVLAIMAYGVASQSVRYPNAPISWNLLKDVFYLPYWQMYGELFLDNVEGNFDIDCSNVL